MKFLNSVLLCFSVVYFAFGQTNPNLNKGITTDTSIQIFNLYSALTETNSQRLIHHFKSLDADVSGMATRFRFSALTGLNVEENIKSLSNHLPVLIGFSSDSGVGFEISEQQTDALANIHLKFDQTYHGLPVFNGQYLVHLYKDNTMMAHGRAVIPEQQIAATINEQQSFQTAKEYFIKAPIGSDPSANLVDANFTAKSIKLGYQKNPETTNWNLIYRIEMVKDGVYPWIVYVDALDNKVLKSYKNYCGFCPDKKNHSHHLTESCESENDIMLTNETTLAKDLQDVERSIHVWREGMDVYLIDGSKPMFNAAQFKLTAPIGAIWTQDAKSGNSSQAAVQIYSSTNNFPKAGISAHYNAGLVYDYFLNTHNRNSINGNGGTIRSLINFDKNYEGAFWAENTIFYGIGNLTNGYKDFAGSLDVGAHEITHGIIDATSGLEYVGESGAINESFADIFGVMVDRDDWGLGEDVIIQGHPDFPTGLQRNVANPQQGLTNMHWLWQPDHVKSQYKGAADAGGVHLNSGIPNFAFYKFVQGLIAKTGTEEDAKKIAEKVYYHAMNFYLIRQANFKDLRAAIEQSCFDLYPLEASIKEKASMAFEEVGIGTSPQPGGGIFDFTDAQLKPNQGIEYVLSSKFNATKSKNEGLYISETAVQNLIKISSLDLLSRPSVLDDGSAIYFVATDYKVYKLIFNSATKAWDQSVVLDKPNYRNVAVAKDGRFLALLEKQVLNNNNIIIKDLITGNERKFVITNPVFDVTVKSSRVVEISTMEFDHSGRYLMYDCYNEHSHNGNYKYHQWDIGFLRFWDLPHDKFADGAIEKLFRAPLANPSAKRLYHFKNPNFSKNSPTVMAMDFYISDYNSPTVPLENAIVGCNVEKGELHYIQEKTKGFGFPNFSVLDLKVSFDDGFTSSPLKPVKSSVVPIDQTKMKSIGIPALLFQGNRWATFFAQGFRKNANSLPTAVDDQFDLNEDNELTAYAYTNDVLSLDIPNAFKLKGNNGGALHGSVTIKENGEFTYKPNPNFHGTDAFVYELCDVDMDCQSATVILTVNSVDDLPIIADDEFTINEDQSLSGDVGLNDIPSGDGGNIWALNGQNGGAQHATVTLDNQGKFHYIPVPDYYGNDEFSYSICDQDQDCFTAKVKIRIQSVNDVSVALNDRFNLIEDISFSGNVGLNDTLSGDGTNDFKLVGPNGGAKHAIVRMTIGGAFFYKPEKNYNGDDGFTYEICDTNQDCSRAMVSLSVSPINDFPRTADDNFITLEDMVLNESVASNDTASGDIFDSWKLVGTYGGAKGGAVIMNMDGSFSYSPFHDFYGQDQFQYELCDGHQDCALATVFVRVKPFNVSPQTANDLFKIKKNEIFQATVDQYDSYSSVDKHFYKSNELNGESLNGKDIEINNYESIYSLMVKPNPFNDQTEIEFSGHVGPITLSIYNTFGLKVFEENVSSLTNHFKFIIDTRHFESGMYVLDLQGPNFKLLRKLIKN
ncbi:MAG: tandem-95 repeat protein [Saprospiraceae bacterium]|nr:tandem-95 repeat protein [Saprospiraceae bacterium]